MLKFSKSKNTTHKQIIATTKRIFFKCLSITITYASKHPWYHSITATIAFHLSLSNDHQQTKFEPLSVPFHWAFHIYPMMTAKPNIKYGLLSVPVSSPACSLPACGCSQCDCSKVLHPRCCSQVLTQVQLLEDRSVQLQLPWPTLRPPWLLLYSTPVIIIITTMIIIIAMMIIMVMLVMSMRCFEN